MDIKAILNLVKPVIIITIAVVGGVFSETTFSKGLFIAIVALSLVFRSKSIWAGLKEIWKAITGKKE